MAFHHEIVENAIDRTLTCESRRFSDDGEGCGRASGGCMAWRKSANSLVVRP